MKIVVAIDSYKGSITSLEAGSAIKEGILRSNPKATVEIKPLADGGEGTKDALLEGLHGENRTIEVMGPLRSKVIGEYAIVREKNLAIFEMATASGIALLGEKRNPMNATTYGVGEIIKEAIREGCRNFLIGIGGSATNDGGIGMLQALGYEFLDKEGRSVPLGAQALGMVHRISDCNVIHELKECEFKIACDVTNPLCGELGATYVYGPQKGIKERDKEVVDENMLEYARKVASFTGKDERNSAGAGAAGGLGFAFLSFLNGKLLPGVEVVLEVVGLEESIKNADMVITGEGRIDAQTAMGKGPMGVAQIGKKYGKKVIALAGSIGEGAQVCNKEGLDAFICIQSGPISL
ncbi:MAG: glycerate kinase, partial [Eubacteriales bacterium]